MKKRVAELEGAELDYWVERADGYSNSYKFYLLEHGGLTGPSRNWAKGGPIIEREKLEIGTMANPNVWYAEPRYERSKDMFTGASPLIAAMRCFVALKYGDEVDAP